MPPPTLNYASATHSLINFRPLALGMATLTFSSLSLLAGTVIPPRSFRTYDLHAWRLVYISGSLYILSTLTAFIAIWILGTVLPPSNTALRWKRFLLRILAIFGLFIISIRWAHTYSPSFASFIYDRASPYYCYYVISRGDTIIDITLFLAAIAFLRRVAQLTRVPWVSIVALCTLSVTATTNFLLLITLLILQDLPFSFDASKFPFRIFAAFPFITAEYLTVLLPLALWTLLTIWSVTRSRAARCPTPTSIPHPP